MKPGKRAEAGRSNYSNSQINQCAILALHILRHGAQAEKYLLLLCYNFQDFTIV